MLATVQPLTIDSFWLVRRIFLQTCPTHQQRANVTLGWSINKSVGFVSSKACYCLNRSQGTA